MAESLEDLLSEYWDIAYQEGQSGRPNGTQAQEVLSAIRAVVEQARREERESCLNTRIVDHDMLGSPITTRMILELGEPRNEKGGS